MSAAAPVINISRRVFTQESFDEQFGVHYVDLTVAGRIRSNFGSFCRGKCVKAKAYARTCLPAFQWMPDYNWKHDIVKDLIAGLTVGIMNIPQGMGYGMLAGLPPVYGLYTSFFLPVIYALLGTSRHISFGTFAVVSLMVSAAVDRAVPVDRLSNATDSNLSSDEPSILSWFCGSASGGAERDVGETVDAAVTLTFLVGLCQICFGLLHMGFISVYLSDQLVEGLTTAASLLVFTSQVSQLVGVTGVPQPNGVFGLLKFYGCLLFNLKSVNWATFITSCICLLLLIVVKELIEPSFKKKYRFPIPVELFIIIVATVTYHYTGLHIQYDVKTVGEIPKGLRSPRLPTFSLAPRLLPDAITSSIVIFSIGISMGKLFAKKHDYEIVPNQEWFAIGISHLVGSFFWCHLGGSSLSRSAVQEQQGNKSQIASVVSAFLILIVVLVLAPLFQNLPTCALAAIIIVSVKGMLMQFRKLPSLWRYSKVDFLIWIVSFLAVALLDITFGLAVAVVFALTSVVFRSQWPDSICLGRLPGTEMYKGLNAYEKAIEPSGIKIYRFDSPLYFANADLFKEELNKQAGVDVVQEKAKRCRNLAKVNLDSPIQRDLSIAELCNQDAMRTIIIDCSSFPYVDLMGLEALRQVYEDYTFLGIPLAFAGVKVAVRQMMDVTHFYERVPKSALFPSVHDAVCTYSPMEHPRSIIPNEGQST